MADEKQKKVSPRRGRPSADKKSTSPIVKILFVLVILGIVAELFVAIFITKESVIWPKDIVDKARVEAVKVVKMAGLEETFGLSAGGDTVASRLFSEGKYQVAIDTWEEVITAIDPASEGASDKIATLRIKTGLAYRQLHDYESAIEEYKLALAEDSTNSEAHLGIGLSKKSARDFSGAKKSLNTALNSGLRTAEVHFELGRIHSFMDDFTKCRDSFTKAIALDKAYAGVYFYKGLCLEALGNKSGAESAFIEEGARNTKYSRRASVEAERLGESAEEREFKLYGVGKGFLALGGKGLYAKAVKSRALDSFFELLKINPGSMEARLEVGNIYLALKLPQYAKKEFEKGLLVNPELTGLSSALANLDTDLEELPVVPYATYKLSTVSNIVKAVKSEATPKEFDAISGLSLFWDTYRIRTVLPEQIIPASETTFFVTNAYARIIKKNNPENSISLTSKQMVMYSHEVKLKSGKNNVKLVFWAPTVARILNEVSEDQEIDLFTTLAIDDSATNTTYLFVDGFNYDDNKPDF
ncbi:MAG: hypothetical protein KAT46_08005 [Deltaproteobacteria bacterium]|nr:hypothetical protein [Deltaproteobacteria bacterium]